MSRSLWKFFTSLRLTVACLAVGVVLVFLGTWAQVDEGLWNAQTRWFRAFFIWWTIPHSALRLPVFPGGYLVGTLLLLNLLAAHVKRFTWAPRKFGIQLTHLGVILLLVGQLVTDMLMRESLLSLHEGETKNYSESQRNVELAVATDAGDEQEEVVSVPEAMLAGHKEIRASQLPVSILVKDYQPNGQVLARATLTDVMNRLTTALATVEAEYSTPDGLVPQAERSMQTPGRQEVWQAALKAVGETDSDDLVEAARRVTADPAKAQRLCTELKTRFRGMMLEKFKMSGGEMSFVADHLARGEKLDLATLPVPATQGVGKEAAIFPLPELKDMDARNLPYAVLELVQEGKSLGTWLVAPTFRAQEITLNGKAYRLALRFERTYHNFATTLLKATHDVYLGTEIPKNFQSRVRINNPGTGEAREVDIYMNNPLRYAGLTFYQYQMGADEAARNSETSTLQVVRNPGWITPYLGCLMVAAGMVYQFLFHLVAFIAKRRQTASPARR